MPRQSGRAAGEFHAAGRPFLWLRLFDPQYGASRQPEERRWHAWLSNLGPVTCPLANTFAAWARFGVDRAAQQILGTELVRIETMGSYNCRNVSGSGKRSAHARAQAIDVSGFVLADGRRISVLGDWTSGTASEREFLRVVHTSACKRFGTVLGPRYNAAHADHFHLELSRAGFCR